LLVISAETNTLVIINLTYGILRNWNILFERLIIKKFYFIFRAVTEQSGQFYTSQEKLGNIANNKYFVKGSLMMFGRGKIKSGEYVFVSQKYDRFNRLIIGRVNATNNPRIHVQGFYVVPTGLINKVLSGQGEGRLKEVLSQPDPNNCIFMLIDTVETGTFNEEVDENTSKIAWINEERYHVLDGWVKENLPEMFANVLRARTQEDRAQARAILLEKMNSLYERDLKDHLYAVARSTRIL
jgi:hypothetical protein